MSTLQLVVSSPREAHEVMNGLYREVVKPYTAKGAQGVLTWQTHNEYLRLKLRAAFHGPVLKAISEQVWFTDEQGRSFRYSRDVWKEFFKREFLTPVMEEYTVKRTGEVKLRQRRLSTEELSDDDYQLFLMEVQAFAITDLGVEFEEEGY